jgi:glycerol-3-phosphate dehydrogenase
MMEEYDLAIIGGGINGCGCAADASLRGLKTFLCEKGDLASQTSSRSTKLIHGGLRYLEFYQFGLVRKSLNERQILLEVAPHLIQPLAVFLPHKKQRRPAWLIRFGLFLYDHLSSANKLPKTKTLERKAHSRYFAPLKKFLQKGFRFYDACTDDARLTLSNALQAYEHGASINSYTELLTAHPNNGSWQLTLLNHLTGDTYQVQAKCLINATGSWVNAINAELKFPLGYPISLVKGSHILTHKLYEGNYGYLLQHADKRVIFVLPYFGYSLIGTTDVYYDEDPAEVHITQEEITYLLSAVEEYFEKVITPNNIIYSWSGVRSLLAQPGTSAKNLSRDYILQFSSSPAPMLSIYGGKITTYRQLSKDAIDTLSPLFKDLPNSSTHRIMLPGGSVNNLNFSEYNHLAHEKYFWLEEETLYRYLKTYGTRTESLLKNKFCRDDLGYNFAPTLYQVEIDFLIEQEWAKSAEDILWRRTKLGLSLNPSIVAEISSYLNSRKLKEESVPVY